jgi:hypothetical protein
MHLRKNNDIGLPRNVSGYDNVSTYAIYDRHSTHYTWSVLTDIIFASTTTILLVILIVVVLSLQELQVRRDTVSAQMRMRLSV